MKKCDSILALNLSFPSLAIIVRGFVYITLCVGCGSSSFVLYLCLQNLVVVMKRLVCWSTSKNFVVVFAAEQVLVMFVAELCLL